MMQSPFRWLAQINAYGSSIDDLMLYASYDPRLLMNDLVLPILLLMSSQDLHTLPKGRNDALDPYTLGKRGEPQHGKDCISSRPGLVGESDRVHELIRPCVLHFYGLLVFEAFWRWSTDEIDRMSGGEVVLEDVD